MVNQEKQQVIYLFIVEGGKRRLEWFRSRDERQEFLTKFMEAHPLDPESFENMVGETGILVMEEAVAKYQSLNGNTASIDPRELFKIA